MSNSSRLTGVVVLCLLFALALITSAKRVKRNYNNVHFKNVQGPPEEFPLHELPSPEQAALSSRSATLQVFLEQAEGSAEHSWTGEVPVDSPESFSISLVTQLKNVQVQIQKPSANGVFESIRSLPKLSEDNSWFGWDSHKAVPAQTFTFENPEVGVWKVKLFTTEAVVKRTNEHGAAKPDILLILSGTTKYNIFSHLGGTYAQLRVNEEVSFVTRMYDSSINAGAIGGAQVPKAEPIKIIAADIDVILPDGEEQVISMHDDGDHMDENANDGVLGATFKATQEGRYIAQVVVRGMNPEGVQFIRSTTHLINVVENDHFVIAPEAHATVDPEDEMLKIKLPVKFDHDMRESVIGHKFKPYAQVYGVNTKTNTEVPVAFITGMSIAEEQEAAVATFEMQMSMKWLSKAQASFPLTLKNVYIQDADNSIPLAEADSVTISLDKVNVQAPGFDKFVASLNGQQRAEAVSTYLANKVISRYNFDGEITETMLMGKRPAKYGLSAANGSGKVVLVHGYCSSGSPFDATDFTDKEVFVDADANRSHDEFANLVLQFTDSKGLDSYSIIAHSQGGPVSLHILTYYWSGQDTMALKMKMTANNSTSNANRLIQSVGSPYRGSTLAGNMASIGDVFGVGCGTNYDLTHDGSDLWLASIPMASRKQVYFYTTQYKDWSWCNMAANLVLSWPNDAVAEKDYSILDGGNYIGHVKSQCHSEGMKYPSQCLDANRNVEMNNNAAR